MLSGPFLGRPIASLYTTHLCGQRRAVRQQRHDYHCRPAQSVSRRSAVNSSSQPLVVAESSRALAAGRLSPWLIN